MRYSIIYIYVLKVLKKNPLTVWSNYLILKFGWHYSQVQMNCGNLSSKKLKKYSWILLFTQHYYCRKKKSLAIKHWPLFRERVSKLRKNPLADTFTILCRQAEDIKEMITLLEISQSKYGSLWERFFMHKLWKNVSLKRFTRGRT